MTGPDSLHVNPGARNPSEHRAVIGKPGRTRPDPPKRNPLLMRVAIAVLIAGGIAALVAAALWPEGGPGDAGRAVTATTAVEDLIPVPGAEVLQQQRVGVVLNSRYRLASMVVYPNDRRSGGVDVTAEVVEVAGLNSFEYTPGADKLLESLSPDTNCVQARFVLIARPEESDSQYWCFEVS